MVSLRDEGGNLDAYLTHSLKCLTSLFEFALIARGNSPYKQAVFHGAEPFLEGSAMDVRVYQRFKNQSCKQEMSLAPFEAALAERKEEFVP